MPDVVCASGEAVVGVEVSVEVVGLELPVSGVAAVLDVPDDDPVSEDDDDGGRTTKDGPVVAADVSVDELPDVVLLEVERVGNIPVSRFGSRVCLSVKELDEVILKNGVTFLFTTRGK